MAGQPPPVNPPAPPTAVPEPSRPTAITHAVPSGADVSAHIGQRWPVHHLDEGTLGIVLAAAKVAAEAGELVDAVIKWTEGRAALYPEVIDEFGDVQVALRCLAGRLEVDADSVLAERWAEVVKR